MHPIKRTKWTINAIFFAAAMVVSGVVLFNAMTIRIAAVRTDLHNKALVAGKTVADGVAEQINTHFNVAPNRLLGTFAYARRDHTWVVTMRKRVKTKKRHVLGFVGAPFILSNLDSIRISPLIQAVVLSLPDGKTVSIWKGGHWNPPGTPLSSPVGEITLPVPGIPLMVKAQWDAATLNHLFWEDERPFLAAAFLLLLIIAAMYRGTQIAYRNLIRLQEYQAVALQVQQSLIKLQSPEEMYRLAVESIVQKTNAIGAYIAVPDAHTEYLQVTAVCADEPALEQSLTQLRISKDIAKTTPFGPPVHQALAEIQKTVPALQRIRRVMAYPVFTSDFVAPSAILVIGSDDPRHFNAALQNLQAQMVQSLGAALTLIRHQQQLMALSEKNEALVKNASDGIHVLDKNGVLLEASYQFCDMLGYVGDEMIGMHVAQWYVEENAGQLRESIAQQFATQEPLRFEARYRRKDGTIIDVEINGLPIQIQGQWVLFDSARAITERKVLEASLQQSLEHQQQLTNFNILLSEVNQAIARADCESVLLHDICMLAVQHTNMRLVWVGAPDAQGTFQILAQAGETAYLEGILISSRDDLPEGLGPVGRAWRAQEKIVGSAFSMGSDMAPWQERAARFGIEASATLPLYRGGELWALLSFYWGKKSRFDEDAQNILEELGRDIGFGLDRLDLARQEHESSAFNAALLNSLTVGVNVVRYPERVVERANARILEIYGISSMEEMVGHSAYEFHPDMETFQKVGEFSISVLAQGHGILRDVPYQRRDGTVIYIDLSGQKMRTRGGEPERIIWTHVDATERHWNEETIRQLNASQESLLANTITGINLVQYPERIIREVNQGFLAILGYQNAQDVLGHSTHEIYPDSENNQKMAQLAQEILARGGASLKDVAVKRRDGRMIYVDVSGQRLMTDPEHPLIVWTSIDVTERHQLMEDLSRQSSTDLLTALPNRRALDMEMDRAIARANRNQTLLAVCMVDLDSFKPVNDSYGHEAGDTVLVALGKRLKASLRKSDFVARLGGDEFVLLIEDLDHMNSLAPIMNKIGDIIREPIPLEDGQMVQVGLSMGVALYPFVDGDNSDMLFRLADQALYESKANKADRLQFWTIYGQETSKHFNRYQKLFRENGLRVFYQPVLDNRSRRIVGMEALARLQDTDGRIIAPMEFLPYFKEDDLYDLTWQVFSQTLADIQRIDAEGPEDLRLWASVNLHPSSLNERCLAYLQVALAENPINPERITFEILEGGEFLNTEDAVEQLEDLRALGVRIALDDVGSAYSSLLRLKILPVDEIKLDQGFVRTLEQRPEDLYFVIMMQHLAENFGVSLVVEGVETDDILDALTVLDVEIFQGYAIARPLPLEALLQFLKHSPPKTRCEHPTSLLGLYAELITHNSVFKNAIRQDPQLASYMPLANASTCHITKDLRRLGIAEGSTIDLLHRKYHQAMVAMNLRIIAAPKENDWSLVQTAERHLLDAVIAEYKKIKGN
ncbi:putative Diguanylate cyclase [Acidithiobacillus ferrivorans]|uniref:Diguanylate cyclase n=2 Tax=Acidithiobacillus ferrivorans TaxID=160808 RepID=A0ABY1MR14_9PROT|nr:EAL domain-containing protein [Acidithiobacillus ferrivorans]SMH66253.1 putative Diguanylate cyclase [Acidithiobacillus ferrivorans]